MAIPEASYAAVSPDYLPTILHLILELSRQMSSRNNPNSLFRWFWRPEFTTIPPTAVTLPI